MIELLFAGIILGALSGGFLLLLKKLGLLSVSVLLLFGVALCIHLGATLFIHYAEFYPFGGGIGDQRFYQASAVVIAEDFRQGVFSAERIQETLSLQRMKQWYPVLIAIFYAVTVPAFIVGKMLSVWFACLAVVLLFLIARELGVSEKGAFVVGLIGVVYPSFLYFGSLLLRESAVAASLLFAFLLLLKLIQTFSWKNFFFLYIALLLVVHLRFYVGLVVVFVAAFSLFLCQQIPWKKRLKETLLVVLFLGFIPQVFGHGYYGIISLAMFLHPQQIELYREIAYVPQIIPQEEPKQQESQQPTSPEQEPKERQSGADSTVVVGVDTENPIVFMGQNLVSFSYVTLGPFPWHIKYDRQFFVLGETIPWFILLVLSVLGGFSTFRRKWRLLIPLALLAFGLLAMISLFIDNFGVYMRIRMPAFLLLLVLVPFGFSLLERLIKRIFPVIVRDSQ